MKSFDYPFFIGQVAKSNGDDDNDLQRFCKLSLDEGRQRMREAGIKEILLTGFSPIELDDPTWDIKEQTLNGSWKRQSIHKTKQSDDDIQE